MLDKIIKTLQTQTTPLSQKDLSEKLGISPKLLNHMLDMLVKKGKLEETTQLLYDTCLDCDHCPIFNLCALKIDYPEKRYRIKRD